jgi:hypothetical protein
LRRSPSEGCDVRSDGRLPLKQQHPPCFFIRRRLFAALFSYWKSAKYSKDKQSEKATQQTDNITIITLTPKKYPRKFPPSKIQKHDL